MQNNNAVRFEVEVINSHAFCNTDADFEVKNLSVRICEIENLRNRKVLEFTVCDIDWSVFYDSVQKANKIMNSMKKQN